MIPDSYENDIPLELATAAHAGTSFIPSERGVQERASYAAALMRDFETLSRYATTDEKKARLVEEFARYREGYGRRTRAYLSSRARCMSTMIAGPSNFPVRRMEKRFGVTDRRNSELQEFRLRALAAIRKALCPELAPIMAGDADAAERLREKIAKAEAMQERMKAANAAIRKHAKAGAEAQVFALVALGFPETVARKLLENVPGHGMGFPHYELTNNGANIRRMRERLAQVERNKATPDSTADGAHARLEDCPPENRVRLFFPGKPEADVRETLKRGGFRWTPSLGCWQAYRNHGTLALARKVAGVPEGAADSPCGAGVTMDVPKVRITLLDGVKQRAVEASRAETVTLYADYAAHEVCVMPDARGFHVNIRPRAWEKLGVGHVEALICLSYDGESVQVWTNQPGLPGLKVSYPMEGHIRVTPEAPRKPKS